MCRVIYLIKRCCQVAVVGSTLIRKFGSIFRSLSMSVINADVDANRKSRPTLVFLVLGLGVVVVLISFDTVSLGPLP